MKPEEQNARWSAADVQVAAPLSMVAVLVTEMVVALVYFGLVIAKPADFALPWLCTVVLVPLLVINIYGAIRLQNEDATTFAAKLSMALSIAEIAKMMGFSLIAFHTGWYLIGRLVAAAIYAAGACVLHGWYCTLVDAKQDANFVKPELKISIGEMFLWVAGAALVFAAMRFRSDFFPF